MSQLIVESDPPPAYRDVADRGKTILLYVTTAPSLWVPLTTIEITLCAKQGLNISNIHQHPILCIT